MEKACSRSSCGRARGGGGSIDTSVAINTSGTALNAFFSENGLQKVPSVDGVAVVKREAIPMLGPGKRFTLHTMSLLIFNVHLNSAQDSPCHLELNVLKKRDPQVTWYLFN